MAGAQAPSPSFADFRKEGLAFVKAARKKAESGQQDGPSDQWQEVVPEGGSFVVRSTESGGTPLHQQESASVGTTGLPHAAANPLEHKQKEPDRWDQDQWRVAFEHMVRCK